MKIVIVGAGSVGSYLIERLVGEHHDIVVVDQGEKILSDLSNSYDIKCVQGNASALVTLREAGVGDADVFIAATDSDETNLISCLLADSLRPHLNKIARVRELVTDDSHLSERIASVFDHFSNPDLEAVAILLRLIEVPGAVEVMEFGDGRIWVVGVVLDDASPVTAIKLRQLAETFDLTDLLVVAIARRGQLIIPTGEDELEAGDEVYVAIKPERVSSVFRIFSQGQEQIDSVMIHGGTQLSRILAHELSDRGLRVKLIDPDSDRCVELADTLNDVLVLQGDGTDQDLLQEEGVSDIDLFIGASSDEEENILSALLAKKLGARMGAVIATKRSYLNLAPQLGVDIVVSPHVAAASRILRFVRSGAISSVVSTRDDSAEILEIIAVEGAKLVGIPLKEVQLPTGVIVVSLITEDGVVIPKGHTVITPGDRVIFFLDRKSLPKLQKLLS